MIEKPSICVVGLGYIGLPTAALLANLGYMVHGVDVNQDALKKINSGEAHIIEPGLDSCLKTAIESGFFNCSSELVVSDVYMICVPTPFKKSSGTPVPNLDYVKEATKVIAPHLKLNDLVILESTSPVGTTELVANLLSKSGIDISKISIAYCPERVLPGNILEELIQNDRIVGGLNDKATNAVVKFYQGFVSGDVIPTSARAAEMCKLTENSFRDVNIAFANELSVICEKEGIDVWELIGLANRHPRVDILSPGAGVGGHCIAVDPWFIVSRHPKDAHLIKNARKINDDKPLWVVQKIIDEAERLSEKLGRIVRIGCLGLSFKADIDDLRGSPAMKITKMLVEHGFDVIASEPNVEKVDGLLLTNFDDLVEEADIVAVLVSHASFKTFGCVQKLKKVHTLDFTGLLHD